MYNSPKKNKGGTLETGCKERNAKIANPDLILTYFIKQGLCSAGELSERAFLRAKNSVFLSFFITFPDIFRCFSVVFCRIFEVFLRGILRPASIVKSINIS